ncbi:2OG-Fe(II) oxygenase family protein [Kordiimonas laminariae]|uniref:2OG-Fe(II) oxygenase family protein n=1 Tax=Kordiimonas laminariae TaxID=2917717 RepID=UPI001FF366D3|nr:tetratricopeptide repeat protein [Kordiimonas laminariae]MCK0069233.1 tetratricopeptide repeat protein [Kordiimonas laminariae]
MINAEQFIQSTLQKAHGFLQNNQIVHSEKLVRDLLNQYPNEPNSLHLLGLIYKKNNQFDAAVSSLEKAIQNGADTIAVSNSLGSTYYAQGNYKKALDTYDKVLSAQPHHADALYNSALTAIALNEGNTALNYAQTGIINYPNDPKFKYIEAQALGQTGQIDAAIEKYEYLLELNLYDFQTLYALAVLLRENGRFEEAKKYILIATRALPKSKEAWFVLANIHYQLGEAEEADIAFRRVLTLDPIDTETHQLLNNLYFEFGYNDKFAKSFAIGIAQAPTSIPLRITEIDALLQAERYDECAAALKKAEKDLGTQAVLKARFGTLCARKKDLEGAVDYLETAHQLSPEDPAIATSLARYMIGIGKDTEALDILDTAEKTTPFDQNLWALRGTAWTIMGDHKKADWLFGYDRFVTARHINLPAGYLEPEEFLNDLTNQLNTLHTAQNAPINQTLKHGTQTIGQLLEHDVAIIQSYKQALQSTVQDIINALPNDDEHPFLKRKTGAFRFSASWSVKLTQTGFHISHVHPAGWLSSAFYVAFDKSTVSDDPSRPDGWLHFGVPGIDLPGKEVPPARLVKPEPGLLALFPSYCWHGTNPIVGNGVRLTAPFDVLPI